MTRILTISGLSKGFTMHHLESGFDAFENLSFTLDAGEFLLLKGVNGAGKSTLLRTLYRTYLPGSGQIVLNSSYGDVDLASAADVDIAALRRTDMGFVTQFLTARPRVAAEALVAEPLRLAGEDMTSALDQARSALAAFGLREALWKAYPSTFSGGEQQKVNLARALILPRRLLLLDEPTASLDASARAALITRLDDLKSQGTALIGVFHHPGDVQSLITRVLDLTPDAIATPDEERADVVL